MASLPTSARTAPQQPELHYQAKAKNKFSMAVSKYRRNASRHQPLTRTRPGQSGVELVGKLTNDADSFEPWDTHEPSCSERTAKPR